MPQPTIRRWITNGVALAVAMTLTVFLAGHFTGARTGSIAGLGSDAIGVTPAASSQPDARMPDVELTSGFDLLDRWRDVLRTPSGGSTAATGDAPAAPARVPDGVHSMIRTVAPQLFPDTMSESKQYLLTEALDLLLTPLSNMIARSRLGFIISPLVALNNSASAFIGHMSGDSPDPMMAMVDLIHVPGDVLNGFHNGADLNLGPLASTLTDAGMLPEDFDTDSLHIGLGGYDYSKARTGTLSRLLHEVGHGVLGNPLSPLAGR